MSTGSQLRVVGGNIAVACPVCNEKPDLIEKRDVDSGHLKIDFDMAGCAYALTHSGGRFNPCSGNKVMVMHDDIDKVVDTWNKHMLEQSECKGSA